MALWCWVTGLMDHDRQIDTDGWIVDRETLATLDVTHGLRLGPLGIMEAGSPLLSSSSPLRSSCTNATRDSDCVPTLSSPPILYLSLSQLILRSPPKHPSSHPPLPGGAPVVAAGGGGFQSDREALLAERRLLMALIPRRPRPPSRRPPLAPLLGPAASRGKPVPPHPAGAGRGDAAGVRFQAMAAAAARPPAQAIAAAAAGVRHGGGADVEDRGLVQVGWCG